MLQLIIINRSTTTLPIACPSSMCPYHSYIQSSCMNPAHLPVWPELLLHLHVRNNLFHCIFSSLSILLLYPNTAFLCLAITLSAADIAVADMASTFQFGNQAPTSSFYPCIEFMDWAINPPTLRLRLNSVLFLQALCIITSCDWEDVFELLLKLSRQCCIAANAFASLVLIKLLL